MKRLIASNLTEGDIFKCMENTCQIIFDDIRNFSKRKVVTLYGDILSPVIYMPNKDTFTLIFSYIDAVDNLFGYNDLTMSYKDITKDEYEIAFANFMKLCKAAYTCLYVKE